MPAPQSLPPWFNLKGNNQNPMELAQMSEQLGPEQMSSPMDQGQFNSIQAPQVVPVNDPNKTPTAQPTVGKIGTTPGELVPSQPTLAGMNPYSAETRQLLMNWAPIKNPAMEQQMKDYSENAGNAIQDQKGAVQNMKEMLAKYQQASQGTDWRPLAALVDTQFGGGGNFGKAAEGMAPETPAQKLLHESDMVKQIAAAQGGLTKDQLDMLKQGLMQQSYIENRAGKQQIAQMGDLTKLAAGNPMGMRAATMQDRLAAQAMNSIHNDDIIKGATKQMQQMALDKHTIETAPIYTQQLFNETQKGIANAISGGKSAAVSDTEAMKIKTIEADWANLKQRVEGHPEDINSPEIKEYLKNTIDRLNEAYQSNAYARAQQKLAGGAKAYANTPNALAAMQDAAASYNPALRAPQKMEAQAKAAGPGGAMSFDEWKKSQQGK